MMHINELPDLVLARIFYWSCNEPVDTPPLILYKSKVWRARLALLAVCRIWRELALPSVHRASFIRCIHVKKPKKRDSRTTPSLHDSEHSDEEDSDLESSDEDGNSDELDDIEDKICVVRSNLDIIGNTDNKYWPRTVLMNIKISSNPIYSLQRIIEKIRSHTTLLTKVARVVLVYNESDYAWINETSIDTIVAGSIGKEISQLMPHVQYIKFKDYVTSDTSVNFVQFLVKGYAHQLTGFDCPQYALGKVQSFSDNLRHMHMDGDGSTQYSPQICAENLTRLSLNYIKGEFDWSSFESNGSSRNLYFTNLKWLRLRIYFEEHDVEGETYEIKFFAREFNYKVIAPKLETVILQLCPFTLSLLASIYGLATIHDIELELEGASIYFTELDLGIARDKFASYAKNSQDDLQEIDNYAFMNDMFNIHSLAKSSNARVGFDGIPLDFEQIDWKYLLNIEIYCPFHVNGLRTLVSKVPSLETIYIKEITIKENGKLIPEIQDEAATVDLVSPSLKSISFGDLVDCTESERDKFMVYLSKLTLKD